MFIIMIIYVYYKLINVDWAAKNNQNQVQNRYWICLLGKMVIVFRMLVPLRLCPSKKNFALIHCKTMDAGCAITILDGQQKCRTIKCRKFSLSVACIALIFILSQWWYLSKWHDTNRILIFRGIFNGNINCLPQSLMAVGLEPHYPPWKWPLAQLYKISSFLKLQKWYFPKWF